MSISIMFALKDISINRSTAPSTLLLEKHIQFIKEYEEKKDLDFVTSEQLRMSGMYWCLTALHLVDRLDEINREAVIDFVVSCQNAEDGGFRAAPHHDSHILHTLSAVQILSMYGAVQRADVEGICRYIGARQRSDGSFEGDKWGEVDTRFSFCAVATLTLLGRLHDNSVIDVRGCVRFVKLCENFDGGFGTRPGSESHAGQIYCCVGTLALTKHIKLVNADKLGFWLCERQLASGGLNGRPEKLPDVCYSWWVLASLAMIDRLDWIDRDALVTFILAAQDSDGGGIADRPEDQPDPFHTLFGLAGLSLLQYDASKLSPVNPIFCMRQDVIDRVCRGGGDG